MADDIPTLERAANKCDEKAAKLNRSGCFTKARVAEELAASFRSMASTARHRAEAARKPRCSCCGTTERLHFDAGSGGPYRCDSADCMVF